LSSWMGNMRPGSLPENQGAVASPDVGQARSAAKAWKTPCPASAFPGKTTRARL
jgi:hypothetical protein